MDCSIKNKLFCLLFINGMIMKINYFLGLKALKNILINQSRMKKVITVRPARRLMIERSRVRYPKSRKLFSVCSMDVMINAPMKFLNLNRRQNMMVGHKTSIQTKKICVNNKCNTLIHAHCPVI